MNENGYDVIVIGTGAGGGRYLDHTRWLREDITGS